MRKLSPFIIAVTMMLVFALGCTGSTKEVKNNCPECGSIFRFTEPNPAGFRAK